jgi:hypothetical protein
LATNSNGSSREAGGWFKNLARKEVMKGRKGVFNGAIKGAEVLVRFGNEALATPTATAPAASAPDHAHQRHKNRVRKNHFMWVRGADLEAEDVQAADERDAVDATQRIHAQLADGRDGVCQFKSLACRCLHCKAGEEDECERPGYADTEWRVEEVRCALAATGPRRSQRGAVAATGAAAAASNAGSEGSTAAPSDSAAAATDAATTGAATGGARAADAAGAEDEAAPDPLAAGMPDDIDELARPSSRSLADDLVGKDNVAIAYHYSDELDYYLVQLDADPWHTVPPGEVCDAIVTSAVWGCDRNRHGREERRRRTQSGLIWAAIAAPCARLAASSRGACDHLLLDHHVARSTTPSS